MTGASWEDDLGRAAERSSLAWSRTAFAFAGVLGILGARAALLGERLPVIVVPLVAAGALLLVNGVVSRRQLRTAQRTMATGQRALHPRLVLGLTLATTLLGCLMLAILVDSLPA